MTDITVIVRKKSSVKGAPRSKRPGANERPSRAAYWASHRLMKRKIRNLMKHCGLTREQARARWLSTRKRYRGNLPAK